MIFAQSISLSRTLNEGCFEVFSVFRFEGLEEIGSVRIRHLAESVNELSVVATVSDQI